MTEQDRLIIALSFWVLFLLAMLFLGLIEMIITAKLAKTKNDRKKRKRQQSNLGIDLRKIVSNYDKFIEENTKNMYLFEKKEFIKNINSELYKVILKGVR